MRRGSRLLVLLASVHASSAGAGQAPAGGEREMLNLGMRGVHFVENRGQWRDATIRYGFKSRGVDIAFRESALTMHLARETSRVDLDDKGRVGSPAMALSDAPDRIGSGLLDVALEHVALTVTFPGSNDVEPEAINPHSARFNYFIGDDESRRASNVPSFGAVIYQNLYDGIDLHVMGNDAGILKYEFHVAPGADYSQIQIACEGVESLCIDDSGDLHITTSFGTLTDSAPAVWQEGEASPARHAARWGAAGAAPLAQRRGPRDAYEIPARFELIDDSTYRIALDGAVDPSRELIIDPDVQWMHYLGGSAREWANDVAVDAANATTIVGHTGSSDFEGRINEFHGGSSDAFVARLDPSGNMEWMTFLGGGGGELTFDLGIDVAVDHLGRAIVTGWTNSPDFAGRNNSTHGLIDAFVARLDTSGSLEWMTYLGGSADDLGFGIAADEEGAALVVGWVYSTNFEGRLNSHHGGAYDAFILRVHPSGVLDWMTYLGGSDQDEVEGVAAGADGAAWVAGDTWSSNFEGRINAPKGARDAFVARIHPAGSMDWMAYQGGTANDVASRIALDGDTVTMVGYTTSTDFVGRHNNHHGGSIDSFVMRMGDRGVVQWMTYIGGNGSDTCLDVALDASGAAIVSGRTESTDFEGRDNSFMGDADAFVARVPVTGVIDWMTYMGGSGADAAFGLGLDSAGNVLAAGYTTSTNFAGRTNEYHGGDYDAYVARLELINSPTLGASGLCPGLMNFEVTGATPRGSVAFLIARGAGSLEIPPGNPCAGAMLGLDGSARLARVASVDADGRAAVAAEVPAVACGRVMLQALDISTCAASNVVRIE